MMIIQNMFKWLSLMLLLQILACKKDCPVDGQIVMVSNASFEGEPAEGTQFQQFNLNNWIDCSISGQTSPDIHPGQGDGFFGVTTLPFDGETYLGLVVRDNNTWESVGTKLDFPLLANQKYKFSIAACRSAVYTSLGPTAPSYHKAVRLRIWGGNNFCGREELLAQSETVSNTDWKVLKFTILPEMDYEFIQLEAFYVENTTIQYNGNILIDKASAFEPI